MPKGVRYEDLSREQLIRSCYALEGQIAKVLEEYDAQGAQLTRTSVRLTRTKVALAQAEVRADLLLEEMLHGQPLPEEKRAG